MGEASDDKALQAVCMEGVDMVLEAGYSKPIASITLAGKADLTGTLIYHYTLYRNKPVMDQLKDGLSALGVLDAMMSYPDVIEPYFVHGKQTPLTAGIYSGHATVQLPVDLITMHHTPEVQNGAFGGLLLCCTFGLTLLQPAYFWT